MSEQPPTELLPADFVPVCAIGASAGGVGALQTLFRLLPEDLGLAYVVVVHLSPDHPSAMHEIIGACTRMPVFQVTDGPTLLANSVYVIAPDSELVIEGDNVKSQPFTDARSRRAPIDMFFRSIAAWRGDGIAVVLTGAGSDGALGVRAIKEAGGIVMVQEPAEAGFPSMPQNAIATGVADVVAPLARLAERIADAARSKEAVRSLDANGSANDVRRIVAFLRTRTGHDFSGYKRSTVLRRIQRRMQVCQIASPADYLGFLRAKPEEARELLSDLLISVTMFFRDPETFIALSHRVIRPLYESRSAGESEDELRAWVVGCATGEEAYSLAILLLEEAEQLNVNVPIQIFATDLDEGALATAREGRYPRSIEADVTAERLRRFFVDEGTHYRIDRRVRDLILFATHSVVREPPFMRLDLITCRNVLIYLERALQSHVNAIFRYGLKADGFLFLGTAETADTSDNHFAVVDRDARIYRALPTRPDYVPTSAVPGPWSAGRPALTEGRLATARLYAGEVLGESHAAALEASAPPSALVDADQLVLHLSPTAGRFILMSAGPLSGRLPSIVRPELRLDLKLALDRAFDGRQPTITRPLDVVMEGGSRRVSLHVAPLPISEGAASRAIVYFLDSGPGRTEGSEDSAPPPDELQHLHSELKVAQEAELAGRIRHESVVQELRASNEELQSLNEEYRSTAEELETSKEELQSINEELQTVNAELKSKLGIISAAHNDLQNLTASSEIGTLFLDRELRIRMFTPPVTTLINLADADVGRPITNFTHRLEYTDIAADVRRVLQNLTPFETEVRSAEGRSFLVRVRPYRTLDGKVEGAVVTFDDITARKQGEAALRESETRYRTMFQAMNEGYQLADVIFDKQGRAVDVEYAEANPAATRMVGTDVTGRRLREVDPDYEDHWYETCGRVALTGANEQGVQYVKSGDVWYDFNVTKVDPSDPESRRIAIRFFDATARVRAERALRESEQKYRSLFESINEGFAILEVIRDDGGRLADLSYREVNPVFARLTGYQAQIGARVRDIMPNIEDRWLAMYDRVSLSGVPEQTEGFNSDTERYFRTNASRIDGPGSPLIAVVFEDITQRKHDEAALRASVERFRALATTGGNSIYHMSPDWRLMYQLDSDTLDPTPEPIQDWVEKYIPEEDLPTVRAAIAEAIRTKSLFELEHRVRLADGSVGWVLSRAVPLLDPDGEIAEWFGAGNDVSDRRRAVEQLRVSEARYHAMFSASPVPFMMLAANPPDFTITAANDAYFAATLTSPDSLIGRRFFDVFPDDPNRPGQLGSEALAMSLNRVLTTRRTDAMERVRYDLVQPGGGFQPNWWLAINAPMLDASGNIIAIIHQVDRQTELHLAEEAERSYQQRQAFLLTLSDTLRPLTNPAEVQTVAMELLAEQLDVMRAGYFEIEDDGDTFHLTGRSERNAPPMPERMRLSDFSPVLGDAFRSGRTMAVSDTTIKGELVAYPEAYAAIGLGAWAAVPLLRNGWLAAWIGVHARSPRDWSSADLKMLDDVAERAWGAVERSRAEAALNESEARFRSLAETAPALIWQNDADGKNVFINRYFLDYTGLSFDEVGGEKWRALVHPDDAQAYLADYMAAVHEQRPFHNRNRLRRYDGAWRWFDNYAHPLLDEHGRYGGHVGVSVDVTATAVADLSVRESERRQQLLIEGVPQLVWRAVGGGRWTWASPQWTAYTGQAEPDSHGFGWLDPVHPDDRERLREVWAGAINRGEYRADYRIRHAAEGRYRWFQSRAAPARDDDGEIVEWLGTSTDVDDLRQLQERRGVLVAELQHRTRNLIAVVSSIAQQTMSETGPTEAFRAQFNDRLSALSRVQGLLSRANEERITIGQLVRMELDALGATEIADRIVLEGPEARLRNSVVQTLALAIHELATNARKYGSLATQHGTLKVTWTVRQADGSGRWLALKWLEEGIDLRREEQSPASGGYGRELIERALPYALNATTSYELDANGVRCTIDLPLDRPEASGTGI